jgi:hypothetical protein
MKHEGSLPRSQESSTGPYPNQINPVHTNQSYLSKIHFNIIHPLMSWSYYLCPGFPTGNL